MSIHYPACDFCGSCAHCPSHDGCYDRHCPSNRGEWDEMNSYYRNVPGCHPSDCCGDPDAHLP